MLAWTEILLCEKKWRSKRHSCIVNVLHCYNMWFEKVFLRFNLRITEEISYLTVNDIPISKQEMTWLERVILFDFRLFQLTSKYICIKIDTIKPAVCRNCMTDIFSIQHVPCRSYLLAVLNSTTSICFQQLIICIHYPLFTWINSKWYQYQSPDMWPKAAMVRWTQMAVERTPNWKRLPERTGMLSWIFLLWAF